jgi:hypothetical protein
MYHLMYIIHSVSVWYSEFNCTPQSFALVSPCTSEIMQDLPCEISSHGSDYENTVVFSGMWHSVVDTCQCFKGICYLYLQSRSVSSALKMEAVGSSQIFTRLSGATYLKTVTFKTYQFTCHEINFINKCTAIYIYMTSCTRLKISV